MLTTHMERQHHQNKLKHNVLEKPKIDNDKNNNNRTFLVGHSFLGETYIMLKILSPVSNRDTYIITKSPPAQYSNSKFKIKETAEEINSLNENDNAIRVFDDILGSSKGGFLNQFFHREQQKNLETYYLSQSCFGLLKRTMRNICDKNLLFIRTFNHIENIYRDVGGYDKSYDEFKELCRRSWEDECVYLCFDRSEK